MNNLIIVGITVLSILILLFTGGRHLSQRIVCDGETLIGLYLADVASAQVEDIMNREEIKEFIDKSHEKTVEEITILVDDYFGGKLAIDLKLSFQDILSQKIKLKSEKIIKPQKISHFLSKEEIKETLKNTLQGHCFTSLKNGSPVKI